MGDPKITDRPYATDDDELAALLDKVGPRLQQYDVEEGPVQPPIPAGEQQMSRIAIDGPEAGEDDHVTILETTLLGSVLLSVNGPIGLIGASVLTFARSFGEPSLLYTDEFVAEYGHYQDVTAEWWAPEIVEQGIISQRRQVNEHSEGRDELEIEVLETLAKDYLRQRLGDK